MKKILLVLLPLLIATILSASHLTPIPMGNDLSLTYGLEFRTRGIMINDKYEDSNGGWFDNRFRFDMAAKMADQLGITWTTEVGDIQWGGENGGFGNVTPTIETRELYMDYMMSCLDMKVRMGQQYWYDHRSLVLDDYFSGITSDMSIAGIPTQLGFIKYYEGDVNKLDDAHIAFANFMFKMPIDWGLTVMWNQCHDMRTADIFGIPYFMLNFDPVSLDLTAVVDQKMYANDDDNEMGMAFAAKADVDMGVHLGLDFLYVDDKGITTFSPYYENGLYLFGNMLPYDGVQINTDYNGWTDEDGEPTAYMSIVGKVMFPVNEMMDVYGAVGMASASDPIGMEFNVGMNYKLTDMLYFNPVFAIGQYGKALDEDEDTVYMLGGLLKAEF